MILSGGRTLFVINSLAGGGAERVMAMLLGASSRMHPHRSITLALLDRETIAYEPPAGVRLVQFDCKGRLLPSIIALRKLVARLQPDTVLSFLTRANVANVMATRGRAPACIISERVNTSAHFQSGFTAVIAKALVRRFYSRADHVISVSDGVSEDLARNFRVSPSRISVIANPVDHAAIEKMAAEIPAFIPDRPYVVAAGRLVPNKNFAMLIDAFAQSQLTGDLVILGEGPLRGALEEQVRALGLEQRVHLPGFVENPFAIIARATLFAMSSNAEGFPNGLVEAMACGRPVVSTNCASGPSEILLGCPRLAVTCTTFCPAGAVVPPNDRTLFAAALRAVHDDPERELRGSAARLLSRAFSVERTVEQYWRVIETGGAAHDYQEIER
jgi:N-acetylgalactosamine-N,N'-diacetylbacillosaminyl-diphospho-undecaprenol 4-alpha-N-acetylgalactosaminyltransferase